MSYFGFLALAIIVTVVAAGGVMLWSVVGGNYINWREAQKEDV
jgi:hypothetical protein